MNLDAIMSQMRPGSAPVSPAMPVAPQNPLEDQSEPGQPDPTVIMTLAKTAMALDPMALGTILFNALNSAHQPLNSQGLTALEESPEQNSNPAISSTPTHGSIPPGLLRYEQARAAAKNGQQSTSQPKLQLSNPSPFGFPIGRSKAPSKKPTKKA